MWDISKKLKIFSLSKSLHLLSLFIRAKLSYSPWDDKANGMPICSLIPSLHNTRSSCAYPSSFFFAYFFLFPKYLATLLFAMNHTLLACSYILKRYNLSSLAAKVTSVYYPQEKLLYLKHLWSYYQWWKSSHHSHSCHDLKCTDNSDFKETDHVHPTHH